MTTTSDPAADVPVRTSITVEADVEKAFRVFTGRDEPAGGPHASG